MSFFAYLIFYPLVEILIDKSNSDTLDSINDLLMYILLNILAYGNILSFILL